MRPGTSDDASATRLSGRMHEFESLLESYRCGISTLADDATLRYPVQPVPAQVADLGVHRYEEEVVRHFLSVLD